MRVSFRSGTLVGLLAGLVTLAAESQRPPNRQELNLLVDAWAANLVAANEISGTLLVARGEEVLYHRSFGGVNTTETAFPVASLTKPLTVILAMSLVEAGRMALTDTIGIWLPGFPRAGQITVNTLLSHRSGIPHRVTHPNDENSRRSAGDMVNLVAQSTFTFPPDSARLYSSAGYSVLARILELVGRTSYARLLDSIVLKPVAATRTQDATKGAPASAPGSQVLTSAGWVSAPAKDLSFLVGAGSVYSTPHDFFRIMRRLVGGGYGEAAKQRLTSPDGSLSWNGVTNGYRAFADFDASSGVTVVFAGNRFTGATDLIRRDVPRLARGLSVAPPAVPRMVAHPVSVELQRRYTGQYRIGGPTSLSFESPTFAMVGSYPVIPVSDSTFYSPQDYATVRVLTDAAGTVTGLLWGENTFPRIGGE